MTGTATTPDATEAETPRLSVAAPGSGLVLRPYHEEAAVTIYHGDCRQIMPHLGPFDLLMTDPPYGIGADKAMHKAGGTKHGVALAAKRHYAATNWDADRVDDWVMFLARRLCQKQIIFGGNYYELPPAKCWLLWDKEVNGEFADAEMAWTNLDKPVRLRRHMWNGMLRKGGEERDHPTQNRSRSSSGQSCKLAKRQQSWTLLRVAVQLDWPRRILAVMRC